MDTIVCPFCHKEVKLLSYGSAWIGICCDNIIYNKRELPRFTAQQVAGNETDSCKEEK